MEKIAQNLYLLSESNLEDLIALSCQEVKRQNYGFPLFIKHLLRKLGVDSWCEDLAKEHKICYSLFEVLVGLLSNRWANPCSKLGFFQTQQDFIGTLPVELQ